MFRSCETRWLAGASECPEDSGFGRLPPIWKRLAQNCHSEKRSDEESRVGLPQVSVIPPPLTLSKATGDTLQATLEASPLEKAGEVTCLSCPRRAGVRAGTKLDRLDCRE